jgi:hypothetical protein
MAPPTAKQRGTDKRGIANLPQARVQQTLARSMTLDFDTWVFAHEIAKLVFRSGELPPRYTLEPQRGGNPAMRWLLKWEAGAFDLTLLSSYGERLWYRVIQGGDEFAEDRWAREAAEERAREANRAHNNTYVPALGMTGGQALTALKPGLYVAAFPYGIVPVPPVPPSKEWKGWPDVEWIKWYAVRGGWFAWRGVDRLELYVLGNDNPQFWKEVVYYVLHEGDSLNQAADKFCKRWDEINRTMLAAFAIALTSAPSLGRRADLTEAAFSPTISNTERGLVRQTEKELGGSVVKKIDPVEAVNVALTAATKPWEGLEGLLTPGDKELEAEMAQLTDASLADLRRRIEAEASKNYGRDLRTGEMGEASFKLTLKLRGYSVVELQNPSGHGVDLVAIKVKGDVAWIYFFEVKSSEKDYPGKFSDAQRDPHGFVKSRLQRVIDREGHYKKVPDSVVEIAKQIKAAIDDGHPVGAVKVSVHWAKKLSYKTSVAIWRPMPKATARPRKK